MNDVTIKFTHNVARAILNDIAEIYGSYNEAWSWWAYEASGNYAFGSGTVSVVQRVTGDFNNTGDTELVFEFELDNSNKPRHFRITGQYSSYGGDEWESHTFKEVRATERVLRHYEAI